jgi:hypothetical protein
VEIIMTEESDRKRASQELREEAIAAELPCKRILGYDVYFEKCKTGYCCFSPDLLGCASAGDTLEECAKNMAEAIAFHLEP